MTGPSRAASVLFAISLAVSVTRDARAQRAPLPPGLVALDSVEGARLARESDASDDFFHLANQWESQQLGSFCGVASSVMVLNALQIGAPAVPAWGVYHAFTQDNVFDGAPSRVLTAQSVSHGGMTIEQLGRFLEAHGSVRVRVVHAAESSLDAFRAAARANLAEPGNYVVVNYDRAGVGQETMGHISPLGAYHAASDRFLVMDVARYKYPGVWVAAADLFRAMNTRDPAAGASRGYVLIDYAPGARASIGPAGKTRLPPFVVMILVATFVAGLAVGSGVTLFAKRKRA